MFISSNASFDNSTFFYEQLKFSWLVWVVIGIELGGKIDAPSRDPVPLYNTLRCIFPRFPSFSNFLTFVIAASGLAISLSFSIKARCHRQANYKRSGNGTVSSIALLENHRKCDVTHRMIHRPPPLIFSRQWRGRGREVPPRLPRACAASSPAQSLFASSSLNSNKQIIDTRSPSSSSPRPTWRC